MPYNKDQFTNVIELYGGMGISDTPDIATLKNKAEYILNCYNYPEGGIAKFFGRSKHNSVTIGAAAEITGIFELKIATPAFFCIAEAKFYKDNSGTWDDKTGAVTITDSQDNLWDFSKFQDLLIGTSYSRDSAIEHDGGAGNASAVSNMPAGRFNKPLKNRLFSFNTLAQPKLGYWCAVNDRTTWDTTNDFLNFKGTELDDEEISAGAEHLDNIIVGKESALFRCYHTGTSPPFKYYKIMAGKIGIRSHYSCVSVPAAGIYPARLLFVGKDNFYQLIGDTVTSIGDDIKPFFSEGAPFQINLNRLKYCSAGIIREKNLVIWAFSSGSSTTNDMTFVLDYKNMLWALCNFPINCFGIRQISGRDFLYSGTYTGFVGKHDPAVYNNLGVAYSSIYVSSWLDWGDVQIEKKVRYFIALMDAVGAYDLQCEYRTNLSTDWVNLGNFSSQSAADLIGIDFIVGTSLLGGADIVESVLEVLKRFKRVQLRFTQAESDKYFRLLALGVLWSPVKGYRIYA